MVGGQESSPNQYPPMREPIFRLVEDHPPPILTHTHMDCVSAGILFRLWQGHMLHVRLEYDINQISLFPTIVISVLPLLGINVASMIRSVLGQEQRLTLASLVCF